VYARPAKPGAWRCGIAGPPAALVRGAQRLPSNMRFQPPVGAAFRHVTVCYMTAQRVGRLCGGLAVLPATLNPSAFCQTRMGNRTLSLTGLVDWNRPEGKDGA
jgi:hypothetical protein